MIRELFNIARTLLRLKVLSSGDPGRIAGYMVRRQAHKELARSLRKLGF